eukprot:8337778-Pyramimonas_sp.AAC.2
MAPQASPPTESYQRPLRCGPPVVEPSRAPPRPLRIPHPMCNSLGWPRESPIGAPSQPPTCTPPFLEPSCAPPRPLRGPQTSVRRSPGEPTRNPEPAPRRKHTMALGLLPERSPEPDPDIIIPKAIGMIMSGLVSEALLTVSGPSSSLIAALVGSAETLGTASEALS